MPYSYLLKTHAAIYAQKQLTDGNELVKIHLYLFKTEVHAIKVSIIFTVQKPAKLRVIYIFRLYTYLSINYVVYSTASMQIGVDL